MKMLNEEMAYESPQVEVITVEVEKGFAASDPYSGSGSTDRPNV